MIIDRSLARRPMPLPAQRQAEVKHPLVIIVDDDASIREALCELMQSAGFEAAPFSSTKALLDTNALDQPGCLILDVRMPGSSGLDLQRHLTTSGNPKPIIFLTAHGDIPMTVQAMKAGAVDFLTKPVRDQTLLDAVNAAIVLDTERRAEAVKIKGFVERLQTLTPREREIMHEVTRGRLNKQIAFDLGISEVTVKLHRGNLMRKMEVASIGELIRAWEALPVRMRATNAA